MGFARGISMAVGAEDIFDAITQDQLVVGDD